MKSVERGSSVYFGWPMLAGLSVAQTISWGILHYAFPVFLQSMERDLGWSRTTLTGAFSLALVVSGCAAVPVGHWLDARGPRALMSVGSLLAAVLVLAWSRVHSVPAFYALWAGLGLTMSAVLYEPAFAVVAVWFVRHRHRALTVLTLCGGLASTIFVPACTVLLERLGWRGGVAVLAGILAVTTVPLHALLLRRHPHDLGVEPDGLPRALEANAPASSDEAAPVGLRAILEGGPFWRLATAFGLSSFATLAAVVHLLPCLREAGLDAAGAALAMAVMGAMQLPGRLLFGPLRGRLSGAHTIALVFATEAVGLVMLVALPGRPGVFSFVLLFGMAAGMSTVVRANAVAEGFAASHYGRVGGALSTVTTFARALGPVAASVAYDALRGYGRVFLGLAAVMLLAAVVASRGRPD